MEKTAKGEIQERKIRVVFLPSSGSDSMRTPTHNNINGTVRGTPIRPFNGADLGFSTLVTMRLRRTALHPHHSALLQLLPLHTLRIHLTTPPVLSRRHPAMPLGPLKPRSAMPLRPSPAPYLHLPRNCASSLRTRKPKSLISPSRRRNRL